MTSSVRDTADAAPTPPPETRWPLPVAIAVLCLLAVGLVFGGAGDSDFLFGFEAWRPAGPLAFLLGSGFLLWLLVPRVARAMAGALSRAVDAIPARLGTPLLAIGFLVLFLTLPSVRFSGDAEYILMQHGTGEVFATNPLTSGLHIALCRITGLNALESLRLLAAMAGVVFVLAAAGIGRSCFPDRARAAAVTATVLTTGGVTLFFGTIEVYATVFAAVALYLFAGLRAADRPWPALVLGVAVTLHGSALALVPSLLYLANDRRLLPFRARPVLAATGWFLLPVLLVLAGLFLLAPPEDAGTVAGGMGQGPILPLVRSTGTLLHRYVMFEAEHLVGVLNVLFLASPVGLLLVLAGGSRRIDPTDRWLLLAAAGLVGLLFVWNLSYELRRDWELFAMVGLPLAVLGTRRALRERPGPVPAFGLAVLGLFCIVPLVVDNAGNRPARFAYAHRVAEALEWIATENGEDGAEDAEEWRARRRELDPHGIDGLYARGQALAWAGDDRGAAAAYRAILKVAPGNAPALAGLGTVRYRSGARDEGREFLEAAIRADPLMLDVRLNLARIAIRNSDEDRAIALLERGLILSGINPLADEALTLLADLRRERGEEETAVNLLGLRRH